MNDDTVKLIRIPADTWRAVVEALPDSAKLRVLANWFDKEQASGRSDWRDDEVQRDLRRWADRATKALELARQVRP